MNAGGISSRSVLLVDPYVRTVPRPGGLEVECRVLCSLSPSFPFLFPSPRISYLILVGLIVGSSNHFEMLGRLEGEAFE